MISNKRITIASLALLALLLFVSVQTGSTRQMRQASAYSDGYSYTVQSGDSLYSIGQQFGLPWQTIAKDNNIYYPYTIYVGEVLQIAGGCNGSWTYTVKSGDTVDGIASWFGVSAQAIIDLNDLKYPYALSVGEKLLIPDCSSTSYTVQQGDTLYSIGEQFSVSWQSIAQLNNIQYPYTLSVGEVLQIPTSSDPLTVSNPCAWWWGCQTNNYDSLILQYASTYGLPDAMVIKAEMALESGFNTNAASWNNACDSYDTGLMQVNPTCNNLDPSLLYQPYYNIEHSAAIWANNYNTMVQKWGSSCGLKNLVMGALEMYNRGPGGVGSWCGSFPDGTDYATNVLNYYYQFATDAGYQPKF